MSEVPRIEVADPLLGKVLEGRYRILHRLGAGAMSTVYLAEQLEARKQVALKVLHDHLVRDQGQRERFEREARALFGMDHPNILSVSDFGVVDGLPFLVMERLEGQPLDALLEAAPPGPDAAVDLVRQVLAGLAYAHAQGVLHRDLKSENVFVAAGPDGRPLAKLLDFGLVKFTDDDRWGEGKALTAFGEVFGTPAYMSPEQCTGTPVEAASDVYSMGVVLFELLTGMWPFMAETRVEMLRAHLMTTAPTLQQVRPELLFQPGLEAIVARALAKEPADRFPDARAMLAALDAVPRPVAVPAHLGPSALAAAAPTTSRASGTRPLWPLLVVAGVGAATLLVIAAAVAIMALSR